MELILQRELSPNIKTTKNTYYYRKKKVYIVISFVKTDAKVLNKILANQTQGCSERLIYNDQMGLIPGIQDWFNIHI